VGTRSGHTTEKFARARVETRWREGLGLASVVHRTAGLEWRDLGAAIIPSKQHQAALTELRPVLLEAATAGTGHFYAFIP
jgi:hypothetical protein